MLVAGCRVTLHVECHIAHKACLAPLALANLRQPTSTTRLSGYGVRSFVKLPPPTTYRVVQPPNSLRNRGEPHAPVPVVRRQDRFNTLAQVLIGLGGPGVMT